MISYIGSVYVYIYIYIWSGDLNDIPQSIPSPNPWKQKPPQKKTASEGPRAMLAANSVSQLSSLAAAWRQHGIIGIIARGTQ